MAKNNLMEFTENTFHAVDAGNCPLFQEWFADKLLSINDQKSIIVEKLETWQKKQIYALYMVMNPKFNRKVFAKAFGIAYGTARNWKADEKVTEMAVEFAHDYIDRFIAEVGKIVATPKGEMRLAEYGEKTNAAMDKLFIEAGYYKNDYMARLLIATMHELSIPKGKDPGSDYFRLLIGIKFNNLVSAVHGFSESSEMIKSNNELAKSSYEVQFIALQNLIEFGKTEEAIEMAEALGKMTIQLIEDLNFIQLELAKSRGKNAKK